MRLRILGVSHGEHSRLGDICLILRGKQEQYALLIVSMKVWVAVLGSLGSSSVCHWIELRYCCNLEKLSSEYGLNSSLTLVFLSIVVAWWESIGGQKGLGDQLYQ